MNSLVSAVWSDLLIVSYAVPEHVLVPFLAFGQELDCWNGQAYVSLVAFRFQRTCALGVFAPPPFRDFPQWNLRFYVKRPDSVCAPALPASEERGPEERGIVFVKEFVPHPAVAAVVRLLYHEPYQAAPLTCRATQFGARRRVRYDLQLAGRRHTLAVSACGPATLPVSGSAEDFFTTQGWGCGQDGAGRPTRFRVTHPAWRVFPLDQCDLNFDFHALYGAAWAFLQDRLPDSVILCAGSAVCVSSPQSG